MKKFLLLLLFGFWWGLGFGQVPDGIYECVFQKGNGSPTIDYIVVGIDEDNESIIYVNDPFPYTYATCEIPTVQIPVFGNAIYEIPKIKKIMFTTPAEWGDVVYISEEDYTSSGCLDETYYNIFYNTPLGSNFMRVTIKPKNFIIKNDSPVIEGEVENNYLFYNKPISLSAAKNFPSVAYRWQYKKTGDSQWTDLLPNEYTKSISGSSLLGATTFLSLIGSNKFVYVRINYGCDSTNEIVLTPQLESPTITSVTTIQETCYNSGDGKIIVRLSRNLFEYEVLDIMFKNKGTEKVPALSDSCVIDNLSADTFYMELSGRYPYYSEENPGVDTYAIGAGYEKGVRLYPPPEITAGISNETNINCYGGSDGSITISASGGVGQFYAEYTKGNITNTTTNFNSSTTITGLSPGDYEIQIRDEKGCFPLEDDDTEKILDAELEEPDDPVSLNLEDTQEPTGYKLSDGYIDVSASDGTPGSPDEYTYEWKKDGAPFTPSASDYATGLGKGVYFIKVMDGKYSSADAANCRGCYDTLTVVLNQPDSLEVSIKIDQKINCHDSEDGILSATAKGGTKEYNYEWFKDNISCDDEDDKISSLEPGKYYVKVKDANNIEATSNEIELIAPDELEIDELEIKDITCNGFANGSAEVTVKGGTSPYKYTWTHPNIITASNFANIKVENLDKGNISIQIDDKNGCTTGDDDYINEPEELDFTYILNPSPTAASPKGTIILNIDGGTSPYSHLLDGVIKLPAELANIPVRDNPYSVMVKDENLCSLSKNIYIVLPLQVEIDTITLISCRGGSNGTLKAKVSGGIKDNRKFKWYKNGYEIPDSNVETLSGLSEGTYKVEVIDKEVSEINENTVESDDVYLDQPDEALTLEHTFDPPTTLLASDGAITITAEGGVPGYTYYWYYNNAISNPLSAIPASDVPYRVKVTDSRNCSVELFPYLAYYPMNVEIVTDRYISCYGENDGQLKANITGGVAAGSVYKWYEIIDGVQNTIGGVTSNILPNRKAGTYKVEVKDIYDSVAISETFALGQPDSLTASYKIDLPSAYDASNGIITITAEGGTPSYSYLWDHNSATVNPHTGLPARDNPYKVTVSDSRGCSTIIYPRIIYPLAVKIVLTDSISCYGDSDGKLSVVATGGVGTSYTYKWYKIVNGNPELLPVQTVNLSNVNAGIYRIEATDIEGNKATSEDFIFNSPAVLSVIEQVTLPSPIEASNGTIELTVDGGTPAYSYLWSNGSTANSITGLPAGKTPYPVTVTDSRMCAETIYPRIIDSLRAKISITDSISCHGKSDGSLKVTAEGALNEYEYQWYKIENGTESAIPGANSDELQNIGAGSYKIRVDAIDPDIMTKLSGMTKFVEILFNSPDLLTVVYDTILPTAYNSSDGAIELTVSGGTPVYSYAWEYDENVKTAVLANIPANDNPYDVTVADRRGCSTTVSPRLIYPLEVRIILDDSISCFGRTDGKLSAVATGGIGTNYSYQWYKIENNTYISLGNDKELPEIGDGNYQVKVTDVEANSIFSDILIFNEPDLLVIACDTILPSAYDASDGALVLTVGGGTPAYSYRWQYDENVKTASLTNIPANDNPYTVTVTDRRGCAKTLSPRIIYPLEVRVVVIDSITCFERRDGKLSAIATGGVGKNYSYQWYKIENFIQIPAGTSKELSSIGVGTYQVKVTDIEDNSIFSGELLFNEPTLLKVDNTKRDLKCKFDTDGFIQLTVTGGTKPYSYSWSNDAVTALNSSLPEDEYTYLVTDRRGCTSGTKVEITSPDELIVSIAHIPPKAYNYSDASVWVTASGGTPPYRYAWKELNATTYLVGKISHGTYTAVVTDANDCVKEISEEIPNPPLLEAFIEITDSISCNGRNDGKLTVSSQGGVGEHSYTWYDAGGKAISSRKSIENLAPGKYVVKVRDDNDIEAYSDILELIEPNVLKVSTQSNSIACNGDTDGWVEVTATGGTSPYTYAWTTGDNTARAEGLTDDRYFVFVTDYHDCVVKGTAEITVPGGLIVDTVISQPSCLNSSDGSINFTISGGVAPYTYIWDDATKDRLRNNLPAGIYGLTVSGANGCFKHLNIELINPAPLTIDLGNDLILCKGQEIDIDATLNINGVEYRWYRNGELFAQTPIITVFQQGTYKVNVSTRNGCSGTDEINITVRDYEISADFTVATKAIRREITKLVNISYPYPDKSEWIVPEDDPFIEIISVTDEYIEIIFKENDSYTIGLRTQVGDCEMIIYKQINVLDKYDVPEYEPEKDAFLKSFIAYPNPSDGQFTVRIELGAPADIKLRLVDITGSIVDEREAKGNDRYEIYYNIGNGQGMYLLQLISEKANTALKLIRN